MYVGQQALLVALSAAQGHGQPEGGRLVCALHRSSQLPPVHGNCWSSTFLGCLYSYVPSGHEPMVRQEIVLPLGSPALHFIILFFADCTPHPILTTGWSPKHHLFSIRDRTRSTHCLQGAQISHFAFLSPVNPSHLISELPLLISYLETISKCICVCVWAGCREAGKKIL